MIKRTPTLTDSFFDSIFWNYNPLFTSVTDNDFTFSAGSILNNNANPSLQTYLPLDIKGNPRGPIPDIGAYEN
jgi:hypothetical protein